MKTLGILYIMLGSLLPFIVEQTVTGVVLGTVLALVGVKHIIEN